MSDAPLRLTHDLSNWMLAAAALLGWLLASAWFLRRRSVMTAEPARNLVIYASQTGQACDLAEQTHLRIEASGESSALIEANRASPALLASASRLFFIASTTGEGDAPDNARRFESEAMAARPDLSGATAQVLALGDRRYAAFCAFGRRIDAWLRECGAQVTHAPVEVDDLAPGELALWDARLAGMGFPATGQEPAAKDGDWVITARERVLGAGRDAAGVLRSEGLFRITLRPPNGTVPHWEVGDLFELRTPDGHRREYSIASRAHEGRIDLYVRRVIRDGVPGHGSGWLTDAPEDEAVIRGRLRRHRTFRPPTGNGPLLAIGAGSGWAGLRPHLDHARAQGQSCRLIFGERATERASSLVDSIRARQIEGGLEQLDLVLSEAGGRGPYVQDALAARADEIAEFLAHDGRIVLCGRLAMGDPCLAVLGSILGPGWVDAAREEGRLRRDLY